MGLVVFSKGDLTYELSTAAYSVEASLGDHFLPTVLEVAKEVFIALALIVVFFCMLQFTVLKLPMVRLVQVGFGIFYTFVGLVIFLTAVIVGFMPIGFEIGRELATRPHALVTAGFLDGGSGRVHADWL